MEENKKEKREVKIKYKTVMEIIIAIELILIVGTVIFGIIR